MNSSRIWKQMDSRWSKKPYPTSSSTFGGTGCGCCACTHIAMEQERYKNWTPESLRPYMVKKGYASVGQGTYWNGITETLKYLGHKTVVKIWDDPMSVAFKELKKGNRIGIFLFSSTKGGTKKILWTAGGHYVAFTDCKYKDGDWWFYMKDSGGRNHDGWYSYKQHMSGAVAKLWIVERLEESTTTTKSTTTTTTTSSGKLSVTGKWGKETTKASQKVLGTTVDGIVSSQPTANKQYLPNVNTDSWKFVSNAKGSAVIKALQKLVGAKVDGKAGKDTIAKMQTFLKNKKLYTGKVDGSMGPATVKAWQNWLNTQIDDKENP